MTGQRELVVDGRLVSASPPARIYACAADDLAALEHECLNGGPGCTGAVTLCPQCGFNLCQGHQRAHRKAVSWPAYAWTQTVRRVKRMIREADPDATTTAWTLHRTEFHAGPIHCAKAPAVVRYCHLPTVRLLDGPCAYGPNTCQGPSSTCPWCEFPVCARHAGNHRASLAVPVPYWRRLGDAYDRLVRGKVRYRAHFGRIPTPALTE
jgi:hypothetical protein